MCVELEGEKERYGKGNAFILQLCQLAPGIKGRLAFPASSPTHSSELSGIRGWVYPLLKPFGERVPRLKISSNLN